jgi:hypothetical protein
MGQIVLVVKAVEYIYLHHEFSDAHSPSSYNLPGVSYWCLYILYNIEGLHFCKPFLLHLRNIKHPL